MPFALLIIGILLVVSAVQNTHCILVKQIAKDFSGPGNFFYWVVALIALGAIGYIPKLKPISDGLLIAIVIGLIVSRGNPNFPGGGVFQQLQTALLGTNAPSTAGTTQAPGQVTAFIGTGAGGVTSSAPGGPSLPAGGIIFPTFPGGGGNLFG